ncbi:MAG: extracellular solute-binding protein [Anaerolineales bacterium]
MATPTLQPTQDSQESSASNTLNIWLPPQFAPTQDSPAGTLLAERLDEFNALFPNLKVSYRVKAETGTASILNSLQLANEVAPLVLPDLVLISNGSMYAAAEDQLIYPFPETLTPEEDPDWYPAAYSLSTYQEQTYYLPLAADAMMVAYDPTDLESFPASWGDLLLSEQSIAFPPADPQANFTTALYIAEGGSFSDEEDQVQLDKALLTKIFNFYADLHAADLLPANPAQINSDELAWEQLSSGRTKMAVAWSSQYFQSTPTNLQAAPLPTSDGNPFTMIQSWGWAITSADPNVQAAATELARFLSSPEFTGPWSEAANLIPLRPSALASWSNTVNRTLAEHLMPAARSIPSPTVLSKVSTPLTDAVLDVLTDVQTPEEAAITAVESVGK